MGEKLDHFSFPFNRACFNIAGWIISRVLVKKKLTNNQQRLRELKKYQSEKVDIFCSHDVVEFERLAGRSAEVPVEEITFPKDFLSQDELHL